MHDLGDGGLLEVVEALPHGAQPIALEVLEEVIHQLGLPRRAEVFVSVASPFSSSTLMCSESATASVGIPPSRS